ncbi:MAG: hypothetical protein AAB778_02425 [Patescibacteria group bacterium]
MLTKDDLTAIKKIVREEVEIEKENSEDDFKHDFRMFRMDISLQLNKLADRIKDLMIKLKKN